MLLKILLLLLALLFLPDAYIFPRYIKRWTRHWWVRVLYFLPTVLLVTFMVVLMSANDMKPSVQPLVGLFMLLLLCLCVPKFLFALFDVIGYFSKVKILRRTLRIIGLTMAFLSLIILCYGYFVGRSHFVVNEHTIVFDNLPPAFDGYRIAHISDLHVGTFRYGHEQDLAEIVQLLNDQKCDAIMFTGDLVNHQSSELSGLTPVFSRLTARNAVFSVMGNHDYSMYMKYPDEKQRQADIASLQQRERTYGWILLNNDHRILRRGNDSIVIVGVENCGRPPFPSYGDLKKALRGIDDGAFKILLSHDPTHWQREVLPQTDIQLTLSGHTHAGQFQVLGWSPVKHVYDEWAGIYTHDGQVLNVTDGIGAVMFPFRFGAWPEVDVITLKRSKK